MSSQKRPFLFIFSMLILFSLYLPLFLLIASSFSGGPTVYHWYQKAFSEPALLEALQNSIIIGFGSTICATILGTMTALALRNTRIPGQNFVDSILNLPLVLPEIVMGLSLLVWFVFLDISLGKFSVTLAHTTFCLPYVILMVSARLKTMDPLLEEAAADLGATPFIAFWNVTLPLVFPAVVSSALLSFTLSFDDFLITFFTGGIGSDTLPVRIYSMMRFGVKPEMNAISAAVLFFTLIAVAMVGKLKQEE